MADQIGQNCAISVIYYKIFRYCVRHVVSLRKKCKNMYIEGLKYEGKDNFQWQAKKLTEGGQNLTF